MRSRHQRYPGSAARPQEHYNIAIKLQEDQLPTLPNPQNNSSQGSPWQKQSKEQTMKGLLGDLDVSRREGEQRQRNKPSREKVDQRRVKVNVMSLQGKVFDYDKNVFNIALEDLNNRETKMLLMKSEISSLKDRIQQLQDEEWERNSRMMGSRAINRTITSDQKDESNVPKTANFRRSLAGRLYRKDRGGIQTERKSTAVQRHSMQTQTQTLDVYSAVGHETGSKWQSVVARDSTPTAAGTSRYLEDPVEHRPKSKVNNIRIVQKTKQHSIISEDKFETIGAPSERQKSSKPPSSHRQPVKRTEFKEESIYSSRKQTSKEESLAPSRKTSRKESEPASEIQRAPPSSRKSSTVIRKQSEKVSSHPAQNQEQEAQVQQTEQVEQVEKEPSIVESQEEEVTVFKEYYPQADIKSIDEDFRAKMLQKLQIPEGFPFEDADPYITLEEQEQQAVPAYQVFGIRVGTKVRKRLIVRKFKNGIYYQLKPNKNMIRFFNGSVYFGQWETDSPSEGAKNGFGFEYIPGKYYYLGRFKEGMRHGRGVIRIISKEEDGGKFVGYDGLWLKGKPHGYGAHIDEHNTKYMGEFNAGEKVGKAVILTQDGLRYEGEVKKGLKHGKGIEKLVNGDQYEGEFNEGKFDGKGIYKWKNGNVYQGEFKKGRREGHGRWQSHVGDTFEGQFLNDVKQGWGKINWKNGESYEGYFRNDLRHGQGTYCHPNGKSGKFMWHEGRIDKRIDQQEKREEQEGLSDGSAGEDESGSQI